MFSTKPPAEYYCCGATLPAVLLLLAAAMLTALAALRSAASETRLTGTLLNSYSAFALAELGIAAGLQTAVMNPAALSATNTLTLSPQSVNGLGRYTTLIRPAGRDDFCPALAPLPANRMHFEIVATGDANDSITTTHVQGFYICSELCTTADCVAAEMPPVRSYWQAQPGSSAP
jgi:hypothetical protein